jgi:hypothetical protein
MLVAYYLPNFGETFSYFLVNAYYRRLDIVLVFIRLADQTTLACSMLNNIKNASRSTKGVPDAPSG